MKKMINNVIISMFLIASISVNAETSMRLKLNSSNIKINNSSESNTSVYKVNQIDLNNCIKSFSSSSFLSSDVSNLCNNFYVFYDNVDKICLIQKIYLINNYSDLKYQNLLNYKCQEDFIVNYDMTESNIISNKVKIIDFFGFIDNGVLNHLKDNVVSELVKIGFKENI